MMTDEEFTRLFSLYRISIYRICLCSVKDPSEAEDITQDVFLKLYTKAPTLCSDEQVKAWLIRVAINACRDVLSSARYRLTEPIDESNGGISADTSEYLKMLNVLCQTEVFATLTEVQTQTLRVCMNSPLQHPWM